MQMIIATFLLIGVALPLMRKQQPLRSNSNEHSGKQDPYYERTNVADDRC